MPVTAKLSRQLYEKLGDEVTNELVELLNAVDTASRDQLRELNESNWQRTEARFDAFGAQMDAKFAAVDARFVAFGAQMDAKLEAFRAELVKWMFLFWMGTVVSIGGLYVVMTGAAR